MWPRAEERGPWKGLGGAIVGLLYRWRQDGTRGRESAELTGTATGVRGPGARCAVGPTNRPGDTNTGTGPPGGRWPDPDWAGSGRPGMHLRRGFGAGLSAEQTCRALTVGPFLIFRHAPGEGRGPRVCPGGRSPGRVGGAGPRRVADHSAARPEKFSKNETVRTVHGPAAVRGGATRATPRSRSDGRAVPRRRRSTRPPRLPLFRRQPRPGRRGRGIRNRHPPAGRVSADARAPPHQPSSQPYSH